MSSRRVYSTDQGRICPQCDQSAHQGPCATPQRILQGNSIVRLRRETKGRKGAGVTIIEGLALEPTALKTLAKQIKQRCSSGGAIKAGVIEIQGDHRAKIQSLLEQQGHKVKLSGG
ncbi:MAG: stress response translation initiation inhibitor YciH [Pseudomonadota bacterium]|nr:stress response translation initiation inhibitor YciH [Pseudomonadota bacterium]